MKLKKLTILFCFLAVVELLSDSLFSQIVQTKPSRQSSFEAFSKGNYEKAYTEFRELLLTYTKDPLYKYYSGVCLVKLNRDPHEAIDLLEQALRGAGSVKTLPTDGLFYLGRAQQMAGKYAEAMGSYNLYMDNVGKKTSKVMGVPEFLQQCIQKTGQIADSDIKQVDIEKNIKPDSIKTETKPAIPAESKPAIQAETRPEIKEPAYAASLPAGYEKILAEALEFQFKTDSVSTLISEQKKALEKLPAAEKPALQIKITGNENIAAYFQEKADQKYREAQALMGLRQDSVKPLVKPVVQPVIASIAKDSSTYTIFKVLPVIDPKAKIEIDPEVPAGLIYRIQIAVFRNPVVPSYFKGITPVYGFKIAGTDKTTYYAGMFRKSTDAGKALSSVRTKGFKDAFIVALAGNKPVSSDRAILMEKEWGMKPFIVAGKSLPETRLDTIPPTLTFRVEVIRSLKPLKEDIVEGIRKMAGSRGLDVQPVDDGKTAYLIGKFITFETAAEYADLLKRNGYREAQVVARLGEKALPVETARQLVDKLK